MRLPFAIPARGARACDVVGFGLNSVDLVALVAEYPEPDSKQQLQQFERLPGGQTATALAVCARLGLSARYLGSFGDDDLGALSRESLVRQGVDVSAARIISGATNQFSLILVDARTAQRTVMWNRHPALKTAPSDIPRDVVTSARMLLVDCHETAAATEAATLARQAGVVTAIDVEKVRPGIHELLSQIDAIIAAQAFPSALTGHSDIGRALEALADEFRAPLVCVTLGAEGSLARCGGREIRTPPFRVDCVDTTGAGDVFRGAFAAACLLRPRAELDDVLTYANAAAALNCRALGAQGGLPTAEEVERLVLSRRPM